MIKIGDRLPDVALWEYVDAAKDGCPVGPACVAALESAAGRAVVIFGVPGAFTPTCSTKHLPGYAGLAEQFRGAGVDEIWCVSVNDAYVMHAWGLAEKIEHRVRLLGDGNGDFARSLGLLQDLSARGMGQRSQRYSLLAVDGVVKVINIEPPGKFVVSGAQQMLIQAMGALDTSSIANDNH